MKTIMLPHGERVKLAKDLGVSRQCVFDALTGRRDTAVSRKLRKVAIERGGVEFDPDRRKRIS